MREFVPTDAAFILELLNTPDWLKFIGDRNVHNLTDAENYLKKGPIKSYRDNGFGLWMTQLKNSSTPIGMCGLVNRETLEDIDIGFAFLPAYKRKGYGYEAAQATMDYGKQVLNIEKIVAITSPENIASIKLLNKIGLLFKKEINYAKGETVSLFS